MGNEIKQLTKGMMFFIIIAGELLTIIIQSSTISLYKDEVKNQQEYITNSQSSIALSLKMISTSQTWYIVNKDTVSTQPDGQGIVIGLDQSLRAQGSRMIIHHVEKNKKVTFVTKESPLFGSSYTVCGGLLSYFYTSD